MFFNIALDWQLGMLHTQGIGIECKRAEIITPKLSHMH